MAKRPAKKVVVPVMIWDAAWKLLAIRRAIQLREYKWLVGIALANTGGVLPMYYLWKNRGRAT
jgi:hypothetical protein